MSVEAKKLRRENRELEKRLKKETRDVITDIAVYIRSTTISDINQELLRRDITHTLIEAQSRGRSGAEVIGRELKAYCAAQIAKVPKLSQKERIFSAIRDTLPAFMALFTIWVLMSVLSQTAEGGPWYITPMSISDIITGVALVIAASLIVVYMSKNFFHTKPAALAVLVLLIIVIGVAGALLLPDETIFSPHIAADAALLLVLLAADRIIDNKL